MLIDRQVSGKVVHFFKQTGGLVMAVGNLTSPLSNFFPNGLCDCPVTTSNTQNVSVLEAKKYWFSYLTTKMEA